jgi:hypothetical protein
VADGVPVPVPLMLKSSGGAFTVWFSAAEVLVMNVASPEYLAVTECEPADRPVDAEKVACAVASSVAVPSVDVPSRNVTLPVGVPGEVLVTAAVNVMAWPVVAGLAEDVTVVVVLAEGWFTVCVNAGEVLAVKLASP